jgi:hypothetical protein
LTPFEFPKRLPLLSVFLANGLKDELSGALWQNILPPNDDAGREKSPLLFVLLLKMLDVTSSVFSSAFLSSFDLLSSERDLSYLLDDLRGLDYL